MKCDICSEEFALERYTCKHGGLPPDWHFYVVHNHEVEPPIWTGIVFHHQARERWAPSTTEILDIRKRQIKAAAEARKIEVDSNG